jgi:hypothetical protein
MNDDAIHSPGEWLDDELTEQESSDILTFAEISSELREAQASDDEIMGRLAPYMNSFMHLWYKLNKERMNLHTTADGVQDAQGNMFDIIAFTVDFVGFSIIKNNPLTAAMQEIRLPDETTAPIDRVTKLFFQNKLPLDKPMKVDSGTAVIKQPNGKKEKTGIAPIVTVSLLDPPPGFAFSRNPEAFDNEVFRAVCALQDKGNKRFTGHDIYRVMTGNPNALATADTLNMIDTSWKRLTSIAMKLDTGNMGDAYGFIRWIRNRRIIEGGSDTLIVKNQHGYFESTVYTLNEEPTLKTYAAHLGQIGRYPAKWFNTPVNKTPELLILQTALFDHIQAIPSISNHIVYDNLFNRIDLAAPTPNAERLKKSKLRKQLHKMLDYWKKCGVIDGWHEEKQGNSIYCIVVDKSTRKKLPETDPKKTDMTP